MKVLRLAPRLLENLLHVLVLRVLLDAEGRVVANAVRVLPVGPSTTHVRPAIVPDPTEGISSGINTDLSQCVITHCSDPGVSQAPACRRHQSAHWPGPCCSCRSSAGPLSPVTTARAERGERRPGVSRRASEELSASGGASSDRPVGGCARLQLVEAFTHQARQARCSKAVRPAHEDNRMAEARSAKMDE